MTTPTDIMETVLDRHSARSRAEYTKDLADFARFCEVKTAPEAMGRLLDDDFDAADQLVRRYRAAMLEKRELAPSTVNRRLTILRQIVKAANRRGTISWQLDVPNAHDERVKDTRGPGAEAAMEMLKLAVVDESPAGRRAYAILRLALDLGLRRGSITALDVRDVDFRRRVLRTKLKGRDAKREKALPLVTLQALHRWLDFHPVRPTPQTAPLFVNLIAGRHTRLSGPAVYNIVRALGKPLGLMVWPHALRHTAITQAVENAAEAGLTLDQVREFSDHTDIRMVMRYRDESSQAQKKFAKANAAVFGDPLADSD